MSLAAEDLFSLAESRISARCDICFNCCRALRGVSGQPTAVAWCERVIRRSSSVVYTEDDRHDDRRTNENRMVCA